MNAVTVADVVRRYTPALREARGGWLPAPVEKVLRDLGRCRTAELGGHLHVCRSCGAEVPLYNSCRNRHCPQCQSRARHQWLEARMEDLLPVPYFHWVFTVPAELRPLFQADPRTLYNLLFRATWDSLREIAADPKRLGAQPGALAVLHTWNQRLLLHPHIHLVVPGGGLDENGIWVPARPGFMLHVGVVARRFAGRFLALLDRAVRRHEVRLPTDMEQSASLYLTTRESLRSKRWKVYAKPPFGGPEQVLRYLARYTHRVAIGNSRMVALDNDHVTFRYKDRSADSAWKTSTIPAVEFLRRFTLHVLPPGFVRIRYFGFLAHRNRREAIARCREQLGVREVEKAAEKVEEAKEPAGPRCPICEATGLVPIRGLPRETSTHPRAPPS